MLPQRNPPKRGCRNARRRSLRCVDSILTQAKANCMRDYLLLAECETRLLRTKFSASEIRSQLLKTSTTSWRNYLRNRISISRNLGTCARELRDIQTSLLLLIEVARQRKLAEDINLNQAIPDRVPGSACTRGLKRLSLAF
ncbi:hypothetical protein C8R45DRAFT_1075745 [Mycena sanguinolenta]|nr:hypothetical protein C8R45DRAFT_1075745 [Mycena sanguinolenta]